ncbi:hypothetical protein [Acidovorax sp. Leaf160]|uniref:hypothetical protein n=1 Tax=Acidovorax sp. Leaf160 TaxID=1736280 RepID=UPI0006FF8B25|nr:hypothetical protein [Acidovorax sp. Leaf160]KQR55086.1 hypothetical protein ASF94_19560 [Acidovorax sp. Leaf160]
MPQRRTVLIASGTVAALLLLAALAVWAWLPTEEELAQRVEAEASDKLGVPVTVHRLHWSLWPVPRVVLEGVATEQPDPLTAARITAEAQWSDLLRLRLALTRLSLEDASVPQRSLSGFQIAATDAGQRSGTPFELAEVPVQHVEWRNVRWVSRTGRALAYAGEAQFDTAWRPRHARIEREGASVPAALDITREGAEDRWRAEVTAGGRTERGELRLQTIEGRYRVTGAVDFTGVDIVGLMSAFERRAIVAGKADGHTDLIAEGADPAEALRALQTRTRFAVRRARLLTFDLERAVKSAGQNHQGTTPLDQLTGIVRTEADREGTIVRYSDLKATSGVLTATGSAVIQNRQVRGNVAVDLVEGVVGVPLEFGGTVSDPSLSLPPAALAGAAVGTAVAPGIGTAIGARLGETLRRLFGAGTSDAGGAGDRPASPARGGRATPAPVIRD